MCFKCSYGKNKDKTSDQKKTWLKKVHILKSGFHFGNGNHRSSVDTLPTEISITGKSYLENNHVLKIYTSDIVLRTYNK